MSDLDATTPRVFLVRHGETEWTKTGQYTGRTELNLTPKGIDQIENTARHLVGGGNLIDPKHITHVWVSPRKRAMQTLHHLFNAEGEPKMPLSDIDITEDITEWDYGDYEGLRVGEIRTGRKERGFDKEKEWDIWRDGCEGGESAQQVTERLDRLIAKIRDTQKQYMNGDKPADVVVVAHGLILRCFVKRWLGYPLDMPLQMMMSPGAIATLSYKNHDIDEPAFFIGMSIPSNN